VTGSWNDLKQPGPAQPAPVIDNEFDTLCMHVFTSAPGKALLAALRKKHFDSPFNPLSPDRALQARIDNQHFVRELEIACDRAADAIAKRKPA
jgi:hypothetical protein